jgi:hypothetical protein
MHYNARPGYQRTIGGGESGGSSHSHGKIQHISDPGACVDFGTLKSGDKLSAEVSRDQLPKALYLIKSRLCTTPTRLD